MFELRQAPHNRAAARAAVAYEIGLVLCVAAHVHEVRLLAPVKHSKGLFLRNLPGKALFNKEFAACIEDQADILGPVAFGNAYPAGAISQRKIFRLCYELFDFFVRVNA